MSSDRLAAFLACRLMYARLLGLCVWLAWGISLILGGGSTDVTGQLLGADHLAFYTAARFLQEGRAAELYDHQAFSAAQEAYFPPGIWRGKLEAYRNPPFYALLYLPTAAWPYPASAAFWMLVSLLALIVATHWLCPEQPWRTLGWALTFYPVFATVSYGQNSLLSLAVFAAVIRLLVGNRRFLAGVAAGLLWFKPTLLIGLVIWALIDLRRLWPCAFGAATTGAVLSLGSFLLYPEAWSAFFQSLPSNAAFLDFDLWKMHNPRAFWTLLLPTPIRLGGGMSLQLLLILGSIVGGIVVFFRLAKTHGDDDRVMAAAAVLLTLWCSPHTMIYEWSLALIPAISLWRYPALNKELWMVGVAAGWLALLLSTDLSRIQLLLQRDGLGVNPAVIVQISVPTLAVICWMMARELRQASEQNRLRLPAMGSSD